MYFTFIAIASYAYDANEESKAAKYGPLIKETVPFYMDKFETTVAENNGYFVNGKVDFPFDFIHPTILVTLYERLNLTIALVLQCSLK